MERSLQILGGNFWSYGVDGNRPALEALCRYFHTHSIRRTKAALIYKKTGNLRAVQLLLSHSQIDSVVKYLRIEVDDAIELAERICI
ncbi:hypothetical protein OAA86_04355 [Rhodospirillales bacterium]|nr:hypothetical protein [Rhodospirillales bacterium]